MLLKKVQFWLNFILKVKIRFRLPIKNDILVFDIESSKINCEVLKIKKYGILHSRKEEFYFPILFNLLFKFKLNILNYYIKYIELSDAKIIITFIDNNFIFYKFKKYFKDKTFISIQNGHRMDYGDIFGLLKKNKKIKNLSADMIFTFNKNIIKEYQKNISSNYQAVGSLKNNHIKTGKFLPKKNTLLFISPFRLVMYNLLEKKISFEDSEERFGAKYHLHLRQRINFELPKLLKKFCLENKLELTVLGASKSIKEKFFYDSILGKNYKYIQKKNAFSNYKEVDRHQLIASTYSTLGYEAFARGKKICFFSPDISKFEKSYCFGWPYVKNKRGFFYTNEINYFSIKKTLDVVKNMNINLWYKKTFLYKKNIMIYNKANKKIKNFLKKKLKH